MSITHAIKSMCKFRNFDGVADSVFGLIFSVTVGISYFDLFFCVNFLILVLLFCDCLWLFLLR